MIRRVEPHWKLFGRGLQRELLLSARLPRACARSRILSVEDRPRAPLHMGIDISACLINACDMGINATFWYKSCNDFETNGVFNSVQNPNLSVFVWSVGYLSGAFCGVVESWYFVLNSMVFALVWCIVVVFDLLLVLQSALDPNMLVICRYWSVAISACCSFISVLSIVFWHCFRGNSHHWIVLPCRFIGKRRYRPLISVCRQV